MDFSYVITVWHIYTEGKGLKGLFTSKNFEKPSCRSCSWKLVDNDALNIYYPKIRHMLTFHSMDQQLTEILILCVTLIF